MKPLDFVKKHWPEASCEPSISYVGFIIWSRAKTGSTMVGQGETEELAWMDAKMNVETYGMPPMGKGGLFYYPKERKYWGPLTKKMVTPKKIFWKVTVEAFMDGIKDFFSPVVYIWQNLRGK